MKRVFSFLPVFLIFLLTTTILAKDVWLEMNTPNFHLIGNAEEKEIREVAKKLENFHQTFQKSFSKIQVNTPFPSNVIIIRGNSNLFQSNQPYVTGEDTNYITISLDQPSAITFQRIFHDYAHFLINNNLGQSKTPAWLNEGLAEYFGNSTKDSSLLVSQQTNLIPLNILLETDNFTLQNQNEERKAIFNAQSWALLSFLVVEKSVGKFEQIEKFIDFLQSGKNTKEALFLAFQIDFKQFENEFRQFLKQPKLVTKTDFPTSQAPDDFQVSQISEAKSLAVLGDYLYYAQRPKEATEILEKSLKLEPDLSLSLTTLALIKAKDFYYDEAENLAEKAIQSEPNNFLNYYRLAVVLSRQGMTEYGFVSGYPAALGEKIRQALKKSIELNPKFTESYALFAFVNFVRNEQSAESLEILKKILQIAPGNQKYLLRLAETNLRKENFNEARKLALAVYSTAPTEQLRLYSQNTIQRIDSTEYQLQRLKNEKVKYANDDIVTDKPLTEEEIRRLREKATTEQIKAILRRPKQDEIKVLASLTKIECGKEKVDFVFKTQTGLLRLQAKSFDGVSLVSFIEEMSDFRLGCGNVIKENNASIIFRKEKETNKVGELLSIEFVPKSFKLPN